MNYNVANNCYILLDDLAIDDGVVLNHLHDIQQMVHRAIHHN